MKILSFNHSRLLSVLVMMLVSLALQAEPITGKLGDNVSYEWNDGDSTVIISGTGDITDDFPYRSPLSGAPIKSVTINYGVTSIRSQMFYDCRDLSSVELPSSLRTIGAGAFMNCKSLKSIRIPSSVREIEGFPFAGCDSLISIIVDDNNPNYDSRDNCNAIIETATNTLISGCSATVIPSGVAAIAEEAFSQCVQLKSIQIPKTVKEIRRSAFTGCYQLKEIKISEGLRSIGAYAFQDCPFSSIDLPSSLISIGSRAFWGCRKLASLVIPSGLTDIGLEPFYGCESLKSLVVDSNNKVFDSRNNCNAIINTEKNELVQGTDVSTIPSSVKSIGVSAFKSCRLSSIEIPSNITSIGDSAFCFCSVLKSVKFSEGLISIGKGAFYNCLRFAPVELPSTVTNIGASAFNSCKDLTSIKIPKGVSIINASTFSSCSSLASVILPSSVDSIGTSAFSYCKSLSSLYVGFIPPSISKYAFDSSTTENCVLYVPKGKIETYQKARYWSEFKNIKEYTLEEEEPDEFDIDHDGTVDSEDVTDLVEFFLNEGIEITPENLKKYDINKDGNVTVSDITSLIDHIIKNRATK